ncbi:MAG: bifunctional phosphopantothenoylcysteine decarboxylase/phosphopantothenate--cysteine ligase CoaBC [Pikeienuella sp.]
MAVHKHILLIIGGGIAAYKCLDLIRRGRERGYSFACVMTQAATEFVTPLSVSSLSGSKAYQELFDLTDEAEMGHIQLSRSADLVVVAPATADMMAKMAGGHANDLATTLLMATDKPVLIAPAMNVRMWNHAATQRNLTTLKGDGVSVVGPNDGDMACGEFGPGRMAEPAEILDQIDVMLRGTGRLSGKHVLVTSGPTHEPIDPVRYIANRSSGKQGAAIAAALVAEGANVTFVSGPTNTPAPDGATIVNVESAREMLSAATAALPADIAIFAAAVADWRTADESDSKLKKDGTGDIPDLKLTENPDILRTISQLPAGERPGLVVGFAAETNDVVAHATAKRLRKGCDWIVANDVSPATGIMGGDQNTVVLIDDGGNNEWPTGSKTDVARKLVDHIANHIEGKGVSC